MRKNEYMSNNEKIIVLEFYKAHFTAKETASYFSFGYATIQNLYRGFSAANISKYNRLNLITEEILHNEIESIIA